MKVKNDENKRCHGKDGSRWKSIRNEIVKIKRVLNGALPFGSDFSLFLDRVVHELLETIFSFFEFIPRPRFLSLQFSGNGVYTWFDGSLHALRATNNEELSSTGVSGPLNIIIENAISSEISRFCLKHGSGEG